MGFALRANAEMVVLTVPTIFLSTYGGPPALIGIQVV